MKESKKIYADLIFISIAELTIRLNRLNEELVLIEEKTFFEIKKEELLRE